MQFCSSGGWDSLRLLEGLKRRICSCGGWNSLRSLSLNLRRPKLVGLFLWRLKLDASLELKRCFILSSVSVRLWGGLSLGRFSCGNWNWAFIKLKWSSYFSMYQGGCGEASAWKSVLLEEGTELSLNLNGVHTFQCIREAVGREDLSLGICSSGGWNSAFVFVPYFSMYQGGCVDTSA